MDIELDFVDDASEAKNHTKIKPNPICIDFGTLKTACKPHTHIHMWKYESIYFTVHYYVLLIIVK